MKTELQIIDHEHPLYMSMFTDEGNIQVSNMVNILIMEALRGEFMRHELQQFLRQAMDILEKNGYGEIFDTEVRMAIAKRLNRELLVPMKWMQIDYFFDDAELTTVGDGV
jgi:hypothetical protein